MRQEVWNGILDTDRVIRYYDALAHKYSRCHRWLTFITIFTTCGATVTLVSVLSDFLVVSVGAFLSALLFLLAAAFNAALYVWDFSKKATAASIFCDQYRHLATEWRTLWYYSEPELHQVHDMRSKYNRITSGIDLPFDRKIHDRAEEDAYATIPQEFGSYHEGSTPAALA